MYILFYQTPDGIDRFFKSENEANIMSNLNYIIRHYNTDYELYELKEEKNCHNNSYELIDYGIAK